ncbi:MAG: hypothetical protein ACOX0H_03010 [Patescibacteria group bacterium]|jgi:hypothetical protein|nr:hypothetical protein [bacterium]HQC50141.1 hypothetical protein [bacterium]
MKIAKFRKIKEIAVMHNGEQGKINQAWLENECLFAHFIGRLCSQGRKVKFSELKPLNRKAQKRMKGTIDSFSIKPKENLSLKRTGQAKVLPVSA